MAILKQFCKEQGVLPGARLVQLPWAHHQRWPHSFTDDQPQDQSQNVGVHEAGSLGYLQLNSEQT